MISTALSNGDDGMALIYGVEPLTPTHPDSGLYQVLDWIGDWNGDPGQGWDVAGEVAGKVALPTTPVTSWVSLIFCMNSLD